MERFPKSKGHTSFLRDPPLKKLLNRALGRSGKGVLRWEPKDVIREGVVVVAKVFQPFGNSVFLLSLPALSFRSIS